MSIKKRNYLATLFGVLTSLVMAVSLIDLNTINLKNPNDIVKILVLLLPAIGGHFSELKETKI